MDETGRFPSENIFYITYASHCIPGCPRLQGTRRGHRPVCIQHLEHHIGGPGQAAALGQGIERLDFLRVAVVVVGGIAALCREGYDVVGE